MVLLAVFSLNTVLGFACSIGLGLVYNKNHHREKATEPGMHDHHSHPGNSHHHESEKATSHHHTDGTTRDHHNENKNAKDSNKDLPKDDDCCTSEVFKFNSLDKNITNQKTGVEYPSWLMITGIDLYISKLYFTAIPLLHCSRFLFPPPPDILAVIQKYQI
ncbi:MAG: hypothetical protein ACRDEB_02865 [Chitinophagaceae bacterium]